jgi:hypothetical protein
MDHLWTASRGPVKLVLSYHGDRTRALLAINVVAQEGDAGHAIRRS